jgi:DNA adenine methylase
MRVKPLIKYIGNKHRSAPFIISSFPADYKTYYEPFAGSLAVLGHLQPKRSVVCDIQAPLIDMWKLVQSQPHALVESYTENWQAYSKDKLAAYEATKARYNSNPNPHDFLFIARTCYGGVMRFRKKDGYISTPLGPHDAIRPEEFAARVKVWNQIVKNTEFVCGDFAAVVGRAGSGDILYCDPPYVDSQKILYGAQDFSLSRLYDSLADAKERGAFVALSIDGTKKSGLKTVAVHPPIDLFEAESYVCQGGSMLKRFWRDGMDVLDEGVKDRLLLSSPSDVPQEELDAVA